MSVGGRNSPRTKQPRDHVHRLRRVADEIKDAVGILTVRDWIWFESVNEIGKLDGISNKKDFKVIPDQIPIAIFGVKLDRKPTRIAECLW